MKRVITLSLFSWLVAVSCVPSDPRATASSGGRSSPRSILFQELSELLDAGGRTGVAGPLLLDVRTEQEFNAGHIPGAIHFPYDELLSREGELRVLAGSGDRPIVVYCRTGRRSALAVRSLVSMGFTDIADFGGIASWRGTLE